MAFGPRDNGGVRWAKAGKENAATLIPTNIANRFTAVLLGRQKKIEWECSSFIDYGASECGLAHLNGSTCSSRSKQGCPGQSQGHENPGLREGPDLGGTVPGCGAHTQWQVVELDRDDGDSVFTRHLGRKAARRSHLLSPFASLLDPISHRVLIPPPIPIWAGGGRNGRCSRWGSSAGSAGGSPRRCRRWWRGRSRWSGGAARSRRRRPWP